MLSEIYVYHCINRGLEQNAYMSFGGVTAGGPVLHCSS